MFIAITIFSYYNLPVDTYEDLHPHLTRTVLIKAELLVKSNLQICEI